MRPLSSEQENAIAILKSNLHLPEGGFHRLILDLCIEFQLPFQKVRSVLKKSQTTIERKIRDDFETMNEHELTQENWLTLIKHSLVSLAKNNKPIMETLTNNGFYIKTMNMLQQDNISEDDCKNALADLSQAYQSDVYKPLSAMLYTSDLYWYLSTELTEMTDERCQKFHRYPQHMEAIAHLVALRAKVETLFLTA